MRPCAALHHVQRNWSIGQFRAHQIENEQGRPGLRNRLAIFGKRIDPRLVYCEMDKTVGARSPDTRIGRKPRTSAMRYSDTDTATENDAEGGSDRERDTRRGGGKRPAVRLEPPVHLTPPGD